MFGDTSFIAAVTVTALKYFFFRRFSAALKSVGEAFELTPYMDPGKGWS
jgi:hypothetical protein